MKIEMNETAGWVTTVVAVCCLVALISWCTFRYNSLAWEKGYTQQQIPNTQWVVWVKP